MLLLLITQFEKNNRNLQKPIRTIRFLVNIFLISRIETLILEFKASFPKSKFCFRIEASFPTCSKYSTLKFSNMLLQLNFEASFPICYFILNLKLCFENRFIPGIVASFPDSKHHFQLFKTI